MKMDLKEVLKFRNLPLFWKISIMPILAVGLMMIGVFFYVLPVTKAKFMSDKRANVSDVVNVAYNLVEEYDQRVAKGEFSLEEAQKRAKERIRRFRLGKEGYVWVNDSEKMLVHQKAELEGKSISYFKDPNGKMIVEEAVSVANRNGEGFIEYVWSKAEGAKPSPKVSFVKGYKPWGWYIGSGIYVDDVMSTVWKLLGGIGIVLVVISLVVTTATFIIGGGFISAPVKEYGRMMQGFSSALSDGQGDLTGRLKIKSNDEIGKLAVDIDKVLDSYGQMVEKMILSTGQVVTTSGMLKENANDMTRGARRQASQSQQIATAAEEMSQTITDIARTASAASDTSGAAAEMARRGRAVAEDAVGTVNRVHISTVGLSEMIDKLNRKASDIGEIVTVIKEIADQTNLLALNAAIEAARAGEQGRGFAVVADEVRKLAEKTIKATEEITGEISSVQDESAMTTRRMSETAAEVTKADDAIKEVMSALEGMSEAVISVNDKITQIATAVVEQSSAAEEVSRSIEVTSSIAAETETMAADVLKGTDRIVKVVDDLKKSFAGFKTKGSAIAQLEVSKGEIRSFMYRVGDSVSCKKKITESDLPDIKKCTFTQRTDFDRELTNHTEGYKRLTAACSKVDSLGRETVKSANAGDGRAQGLYSELTVIVKKTQEDIDQIQREMRQA